MVNTSGSNPTTVDVLAIDAAILQTTDSPQFGITRSGFVAKPFARLLAEKLALARALFGEDLDLSSASALRKLLEISALEDARTWAALAGMYDNSFVSSATGDALSRLGEELGLQRPFLAARGRVTLRLEGDLPAGSDSITLPRGARLATPGGHQVSTDETVVLSPASGDRTVSVSAFYPGPEHNLDPNAATPDGAFPQRLDRWNRLDSAVAELDAAEQAAGTPLVAIEHSEPLAGGELHWPDDRYRDLLLRAPRSLWTVEAIQVAVSLVPGVRHVLVRDSLGGLDINQSIFGNFNLIERVFGTERDLGSPYYFSVLIAPTPAAIWEGPDGLRAAVEAALEDLRPISIFPQVVLAQEVGIGVAADLVVKGLPLPHGSRDSVNASGPALALKSRLIERLRRYVDGLQFGDPVRYSEVMWALMNEPGIADVRDLRLLRYPPGLENLGFEGPVRARPQELDCGLNVELLGDQIASLVEDTSGLRIV
jgi:hypothetical protein